MKVLLLIFLFLWPGYITRRLVGAQQPCSPGKYSSNGLQPCSNCPPGEVAESSGLTACTSCLRGKYAESAGLASCTPCARGTYSPSIGASSCNDCSAGKAQDKVGESECDLICDAPGEYSDTAAEECTACSSGKYSLQGDSNGNTGCTDCPIGKSTDGADGQSSCIDCSPGDYQPNPGQGTCLECDANSNLYQNEYGQTYCKTCNDTYESDYDVCRICSKGTEKFFAKGQQVCTDCEANFYNDVEGGACTECPPGKISAPGAISLDDCVSPAQNFITSIVIFLLCIPFAIEYVIHARFHRVAFLRTERVTNKIILQTRMVVASLYHYAVRARAERKRDRKNRLVKTWFFLTWSLVVIFVISLLSFIAQMSGVLFASMIMWKNLSSSLSESFDAIMEAAANVLVGFKPMYYFFYAMGVVFDAFANFDLDINAVDITCEGAQAPLELFINFVIMGLTIVIIESNIQIFRAVTFNSMTDKFIECFTQPAYRKWAFRDHGKLARSTKDAMAGYAATGILTLAIRSFGAVDVVQTFLQYMMSLVTLDAFFPAHNYTNNCNEVANYEGFDESLANLSTIFAWLMLVPALYEAGKVLMPGLPAEMESVENISTKRDPKSSIMHYMKYFSLLAPDLWMVVLGQQWTKMVRDETPMESGVNKKEELKKESAKRHEHSPDKSKIERKEKDDKSNDTLPAETSTEAEASEQDTSVEKASVTGEKSALLEAEVAVRTQEEATEGFSPRFRVVSAGTFAKTEHEAGPGFYAARLGYSITVWSNVHVLIPDSRNVFVFCRLSRETGELLLIQTYDVAEDGLHTEGRGSQALAADMNASDEDHLVVLFSIGDPSTPKCLEDGLPDAVARCGGFLEHFGRPEHVEQHGAYTLIGVPGSGEGRGFETIAGDREHALIDLSFQLVPGGFKMLDMHVEEVEDYYCLSSDSYLLATLRQRTAEENRLWKERQRLALPTMWTLCRLEFNEVMSNFNGNPLCAAPVLFLVVIQIGHLVTSVGRRAWALIVWKYFTFLQVCLGWWTEAAVSGYRVHEYIRSASVTWDKPIRRMSREEYLQYRRDLAVKIGTRHLQCAPTDAVKVDDDENATDNGNSEGESDSLVVVIEGQRYLLPTESDEQEQLQQEELKRALRSDYSTILHALIACRSTLLILVPGLASVTILASTMASTPVLVQDLRLRLNLPELVIAHPFGEARALEQEMVAEQEHVRQTEMAENDHDVDNPTEVFNTAAGRWDVVPTEMREEIEEGNQAAREEMRVIINQLPRKVEEWRVLVQGITLCVTESRGVNFAINLYKFVLTMALALGGSDSVTYWMYSAVIVLIPYGVVLAMKVNLIIGRAMDITDEDLHRAVGCCGCGCLLDALGIHDNSRNDDEQEQVTSGPAREGGEEEEREWLDSKRDGDGSVSVAPLEMASGEERESP